jgi:hypothetical protein
MRVLTFLWKCWCGLWRFRQATYRRRGIAGLTCGHSAGIDSHKWESKMETFGRLPGR